MVTLGKGWPELPEGQELQVWGKVVPWQGQRDNTGQSRAALGQEVVTALGCQEGQGLGPAQLLQTCPALCSEIYLRLPQGLRGSGSLPS